MTGKGVAREPPIPSLIHPMFTEHQLCAQQRRWQMGSLHSWLSHPTGGDKIKQVTTCCHARYYWEELKQCKRKVGCSLTGVVRADLSRRVTLNREQMEGRSELHGHLEEHFRKRQWQVQRPWGWKVLEGARRPVQLSTVRRERVARH